MRLVSFKNFVLLILFFIILFTNPLFAQEKRMGLATYEIITGENLDYLKKVLRESLSASLKEKSSFTLVELSQTEEEIKKKGVARVLKEKRLDAILVGSLVKLGEQIQVNTRIYTRAHLEEPSLVSVSTENLDRLLSTLKTHSQIILNQLNAQLEPASVSAAPVAPQNTLPQKNVGTTIAGQPDYQWISEQLPLEGRGMAYEDLDADGKKELILIDLKHLYVYEFSKNSLQLLAKHEALPQDNFVRVYTYDLEQDGKPEILVSNYRGNEAASLVFRYEQKKIVPLSKSSPWLVKVLLWEGKPLLMGEPYYGTVVDYHSIKKLKWNGNELKEEGDFRVPNNIQIYGLQSFTTSPQDPKGIIYLNPAGSLKIYEPDPKGTYKKRWSSAERYGGSSNWINQQVKNFFNEMEDYKTYVNIDPVTWVNEAGRGEVLVAKNDNFLKNMMGTRPIVKDCWFVKLRWEDLGLRELWTTRKIDGYMADYLKVQLPWEKSPKLLVLMWFRDPSFADSLGPFRSVIAIYDLN